MDDFSIEDVKEIVFNGILTAYNEKKQLIAHIRKLEEQLKELETVEPEVV